MVTVRVVISLKPSLLDSAGRTVKNSLDHLGFEGVDDVRIGKTVVLKLQKYDEEAVKSMCDKLLANPVTESYEIEVLQ